MLTGTKDNISLFTNTNGKISDNQKNFSEKYKPKMYPFYGYIEAQKLIQYIQAQITNL